METVIPWSGDSCSGEIAIVIPAKVVPAGLGRGAEIQEGRLTHRKRQHFVLKKYIKGLRLMELWRDDFCKNFKRLKDKRV